MHLNTLDYLNMLLLFNLQYVIIDLTIASSLGNSTSACLMYDSSHEFPYNDNKMIILMTII